MQDTRKCMIGEGGVCVDALKSANALHHFQGEKLEVVVSLSLTHPLILGIDWPEFKMH